MRAGARRELRSGPSELQNLNVRAAQEIEYDFQGRASARPGETCPVLSSVALGMVFWWCVRLRECHAASHWFQRAITSFGQAHPCPGTTMPCNTRIVPTAEERGDSLEHERASDLSPETDIPCVRADFSFALYRDVVVMCHPARELSDASWNEWLEWALTHRFRAVLISTNGGSPNARQRNRYAEVQRKSGNRDKVALLSDSAVIRGVLTAMSWLTGADVMTFAPDRLTAALAWLNLGGCSTEVTALIARLHKEMALATS